MNTTFKVSRRWTAVSIAVAALLAACGSSDDDDNVTPPPTSQVPASASQSVQGFISYLQALVVASAEMLEPVDTSTVTALTDETSEPRVVD